MRKYLTPFRLLQLAVFLLVLTVSTLGIKAALLPINTLKDWISSEDSFSKKYEDFTKNFGDDEVAIALYIPNSGHIDNTAVTKIQEFTQRVNEIKGIASVSSAANFGLISGDGIPKMLYERWLEENPVDIGLLKNDPIYKNIYVTKDGKAAPIWIFFDKIDQSGIHREDVIATIRQIGNEVFTDGKLPLAGMGLLYSDMNAATVNDMRTLLPIVVGIAMAVLFVIFRRIRFVLASLLIVGSANIIMIGVFGLTGHHVDVLTVILPIFVIVVGIAATVHLPSAFIASKASNLESAIAYSLERCVTPTALALGTAAIGFFSLVSTPVEIIQRFGTFGGLGILAVLPATLIIMPLSFYSFRETDKRSYQFSFEPILRHVEGFLVRKTSLAALLTIAITLICVLGAYRIKFDTHFMGYMRDDAVVVRDQKLIQEAFGPYVPFDLVVHIDDPLKDAKLADEFCTKVEDLAGVYKATCFSDIYKWTNREIYKRADVIDAEVIARVNGQIVHAVDGNPFGRMITKDLKSGRMLLNVSLMPAGEYSKLLDRILSLADSIFQRTGAVTSEGLLSLYARSPQYIVESQRNSLWVGFLIEFAVMLFWLRSLRLASVALIPSVFSALVTFATVGYLGIPFDIPIVILIGVILGISIDDTIHMLHQWKWAENAGLSWRDCIGHIFQTVGNATTSIGAVLVFSFPVFLAADSAPIRAFGYLLPLGVLASLVAILVILPLVLKYVPARRLSAGTH